MSFEEHLEKRLKQEAFAFADFRDTYQHIEKQNVTHKITEEFGYPSAITWVGASDEHIWEAYRKGEQLKRWYDKRDTATP